MNQAEFPVNWLLKDKRNPMHYWKNDEELFKIVKNELFTALVWDACDQLGLYHQFLSPQLKPLTCSMVVIGRAMPVLEADVLGESVENGHNPI